MVVLVATGAAVAGGTLSSGGLTAVSATAALAGLAVIAGEIRSDRRHTQMRADFATIRADLAAIKAEQRNLVKDAAYAAGWTAGVQRRFPDDPPPHLWSVN
jgi:hypothetical protein